MEPDHECLRGLESRNADGLLDLLKDIKSVQEMATEPGPVLVRDTPRTRHGMRLPPDQDRVRREHRAHQLTTLWRRGFITYAEHVPSMDRFSVAAEESVVRDAIETLREPFEASRAREHAGAVGTQKALGEVAKGALHRTGEIMVETITKQAPLLWRMAQSWLDRQHGG